MFENLSSRPGDRILPTLPDILPLTAVEIISAVNSSNQEGKLNTVRRWHEQILLDPNKPLYIRLEGRPGFLGDMVRKSCWISLLREWGKREPTLITNYPQLFSGHKTLPIGEALKSTDGYILNKGILVLLPLIAPMLEPVSQNHADQFLYVQNVALSINNSFLTSRWPLSQFQQLQLASFAFFKRTIEHFPPSELSFSEEAKQKAEVLVSKLELKESQIPLLVSPDAGNMNFDEKRWPLKYYQEVMTSLSSGWGGNLRIFLLTGIDHPQETLDLSLYLREKGIPHQVINRIDDLGEFGGLIREFAKKKAVMLGTESLVSGHLAPMLGVWSVIIGWGNHDFHETHRPIEPGTTLVEGLSNPPMKDFPGGKPTPEQVIKALNYRIDLRLKS